MSEAVTVEESRAAFTNMLRGAFAAVAYLRGFCDDDSSFENMRLGGHTFKRLNSHGGSAEVETFQRWLEEGVLPTFRAGFLQSVTLQAFAFADPSLLLEAYTFSFSYDESGLPKLDASCVHNYKSQRPDTQCDLQLSSQINKGVADVQQRGAVAGVTRAELRDTIVEMLVELTTFLQDMPPADVQRSIAMRICYVDNVTPQNYEPPHFQPVPRQRALVEMARERQLSVASHCEGRSGFHHLQLGLMYRASCTTEGRGALNESVELSEPRSLRKRSRAPTVLGMDSG